MGYSSTTSLLLIENVKSVFSLINEWSSHLGCFYQEKSLFLMLFWMFRNMVHFSTLSSFKGVFSGILICFSFLVNRHFTATSFSQLCSVIIKLVPNANQPSFIAPAFTRLFEASILEYQSWSNGFEFIMIQIGIDVKSYLGNFVQYFNLHVSWHINTYFGLFIWLIAFS